METKSGVNIDTKTWVDDFQDSHFADELVETISSDMKVCGGTSGDLLYKLLTQMNEMGLTVVLKEPFEELKQYATQSAVFIDKVKGALK